METSISNLLALVQQVFGWIRKYSCSKVELLLISIASKRWEILFSSLLQQAFFLQNKD